MESGFSGPVRQMPISHFPAVLLLNSSVACLHFCFSTRLRELVSAWACPSRSTYEARKRNLEQSQWARGFLCLLTPSPIPGWTSPRHRDSNPAFKHNMHHLFCPRTVVLYIKKRPLFCSLQASTMHPWAGTHTGTHNYVVLQASLCTLVSRNILWG